MDRRQKKVSYIKKPFARRSLMSMGLSGAGLVLFLASMGLGIAGQGNPGLNAGACGLCSLVVSGIGLWYGLLSFLEKERNYLLGRISVVLCGLLVIAWVCIVIMGMRG